MAMSYWRLLILTIILTALTVTGQTAVGAEGNAAEPTDGDQAGALTDARYPPIAIMPEVLHDFGTVKGGTVANHDFVIRNDGVGELIIQKVSPG